MAGGSPNGVAAGAIATLIDVVGTLALLTKDPKRAGVSVEMNISYMSAAKANQVVKMEGRYSNAQALR